MTNAPTQDLEQAVDSLLARIRTLEVENRHMLASLDIAEEQERNAKAVMMKALHERDAAYRRIAELEAEVERLRAERWEPVEDGECIKCDHIGFQCGDYIQVWETAPDEYAIEACSEEGEQVFVWLPPHIRLRRKEARNDSYHAGTQTGWAGSVPL